MLFAGMGLNLFQPLTGINVVIFYAGIIFQTAGFSKEMSVLLTTMVSIPQLIAVGA